jgi:hypothetical protein
VAIRQLYLGWGSQNFKTDSYDFPLAEANLTFTASKHIDLQLGYGTLLVMDIARCWKVMVLVLILILK